jgi:hypothetical protein
MTEPQVRERRRNIIRNALAFQLKLLLGALRDLAVAPTSLVAAGIDLFMARRAPPRCFQWVMHASRRFDHWLDQWPRASATDMVAANEVDTLLQHLEDLVRDPKAGREKAQLLARWARKQGGPSDEKGEE